MPALNKNITVRLRADASNFNASIKAAGANAQQLASGMEQSGRKTSLLTTGLAAAGMAAGALGVAAIKTASDFDASMSGVQSVTRASAAEMDLLRQAAIDAGADTIYSASEAAAGITELGKAGLSTTDILSGGLNGALDLAASEGIDVSEAAELMATALTQFGLSGDRATDVADALAAGAGSASGSARDLGFALSQAGTMAHTYGISMEETVGALSAFASAGMIGSDAGTSLRSMLQHLGNPTKEASELMDELGISVYDNQGHFVSLSNLAGQLQTQMGGLSEEERNAAMATIFGADAVRAATQLYNQGSAGVEKWTKTVSQSGYAAEMAAARTDNLQGDLEKLSGSVETLLTNLGEGGQGPLRSLVQTLDTLVGAFSGLPEPVQQWIVLGTTAVGIGAALHKSMGPLSDSTSAAARSFSLFADPWQRLTGLAGGVQTAFHQIQLSMMTASQQMDAVGTASSKTELRLGALKSVGGGLLSLLGGPWGIALGVAGGMLLGFAKDAQEAKAKTQEFADAIDSGDDILEKLIRDISSGDDGTWGFWDKATTGFDSLGEALDKAGVSYSTFAEAVDGSKEAQEEFEQQLMDSGLDGIQLDAIRSAYDELSGQVSNAKDQVQKTNEEVAKVQGTSEDAAAATGELGDEMSDTADSTQDYADALDDLIDNLFALEQSHLSADQSVVALNQEILDLNETVSANGVVLDANGNALAGCEEKAYGTQDSLYSLASQAYDTAQAILEEGAQMDASGQSTDGLTNATEQARGVLEQARQAFINNAVASGMSQEAAAALADQLGLTGNKADELSRQVENLDSKKINDKNFSINVTDNASWVIDHVQGRQIADKYFQIHGTYVDESGGEYTSDGYRPKNATGKIPWGMATGGLIGYAAGGMMGLANGDGYTGLINGWGGKKSDVMPIMASRGEFMQQASAVDYYGVDAMRALNERKIPREWLAGPKQVVAVSAPEVKSSTTTVVVDNQAVVDAIRQAVREMPGIIRKNTPVMGKRDAYRVAREAVNGR
ncbi:phage tail tape measure protein [Bifidobacterium longum]|uniref:Phage tail tape measure protein n=1 Tax=Bifidobacterium longum TaxID=216816 RepID=A0A2U2RU23_BIFLN|nr:phage tail tape measure protein [Bifidobacterium longum]PWH09274.1 phage tail tape measure protein [Bifidobacterium longum]